MTDWTQMEQIETPEQAIRFMVDGKLCSAVGHIDDAERFAVEVVEALNDWQREMLFRVKGTRNIAGVLLGFARTHIFSKGEIVAPEVAGLNRRASRDELGLNEHFGRV